MQGFRPLVILLFSASPLLAQGTIVDGDASFVRGATAFDTTPEANLVGVSANATTDQLFEFGWWYRTSDGTSEVAFGTPFIQSYQGNMSVITWSSLAGGLFSAVETTYIADGGVAGNPADGGIVSFYLLVTNLSPDPLDIVIIHMADFDVDGSTNDSGTLFAFSPYPTISMTDPGGSFGYYLAGETARKFMVRPFGAASVTTELNDADVDDFANTGLPFGPGDITAGWQFPLSIAQSGSSSADGRITINSSEFHCNTFDGILCDGFEAGSTVLWFPVAP